MAWLSGYQYRKVLTIDSSKVDSTLTDFPVLVVLDDSNFDFAHLLSSGDDIRFTDADGSTELSFEKEFLGEINTYGSDILSGGTASGDSNGGAWSNPANAVDNNDGTFGNSTDTIGDHWWRYDLGVGNEKTVAKMRLKPYVNAWGNSIKDFSIQGSNNDADWDTLYTGQHGNNSNYEDFEFSNTTAYRYYRIYVTTTWTAHYLVGIFEIEMMEGVMSGNSAYFWVKVPSVLAASDTPFYIYYGQTGDVDGQDATNVWDSYHKVVYHLTEEGNGTPDEFKSSVGTIDGMASGVVTRVYGGIYTQQDFSTSRIVLPDNPNLEHSGQDFTWSFKITFDVTSGNQCFIGRGTSGVSYFYFALESGSFRFRDYNSGNIIDFSVAPGTLTPGTMYDIEVVRSGSSWKIYKDNVQLGSTVTSSANFLDRAEDWEIGGNSTISYYVDGQMDEVRLSIDIARSDAWRKARINGDNNTLLTYGAEEEQPASSTTGTLTPELAWSAYAEEQLTPALQWSSIILGTLTPSLEWKASAAHKFMPNIVNYPFYFSTPSVTTSSVPLLISGCAVGFSIHLKNTGSSGQTTVKIYTGGTLRATKTIVASSVADSYIEYFNLDSMFNPLETFEVEITEAATGAEDLKVNMYLMTFPFEMDKLFYGNLSGSILFKGINKEYLFNQADYWTIDFNQPIFSVASVIIEDENGDITDATYSLIDGVFFNSRLRLLPHLTSKPKKISLKIQDYNERYHVFELEPKVRNSYGDFPAYVASATKDVELFIAAKSFRYSFDGGGTWSTWAGVTNDNQITLDFSAEVFGQKTITIQYTIGDTQIEEVIDSYYLTGAIDANVNFLGSFARIEYMDTIPLDRIEVYYEDALVDSLTLPVITGFEDLTTHATPNTIIPAAGSLYYNTERYDWDGSAITLNPPYIDNAYATQWRAIFGFDTVTHVFTVKYTLAKNPFDNNYEGDTPVNFIRLWIVDFVIVPTGPAYITWYASFVSSPLMVFDFGIVNLALKNDTDITIRLIDIAGREKDYTLEYIRTKYNIWRTLTVTPTGGGDEILPGQIHQEASLDFSVDSEDWEDPIGGL
jgi:hypothetical protein